MNNALSRTVIETIVRKAVKDIKDAPKRSTRNLVDMTLTFAEGRFQRYFFEMAQTMLKEENSAYFRLISDAAEHVDTDKLVTFGLNLGYNSCTVGAKKIRSLEKRKGFDIPWSISLELLGEEYLDRKEAYRSILRQGKDLGVYTWMIYVLEDVQTLLALAREHGECAFIFFCEPDEITEEMLEEAANVNNLMFGVHYTGGVEEACRSLRVRQFLYGVFYTYGEAQGREILNGEYLDDIEFLHPVFTGFLAEDDCPAKIQEEVYEYIKQVRTDQTYPTIVWDMVNDSRFVDSIISEDSCLAEFDLEGYFWTYRKQKVRLSCNLFRQPLEEILQSVFPKKGRKAVQTAET